MHNDDLHNLYSSPSTTRKIKSRRMRRAEHVALKRRGKHIGYWLESQKEIDHQETENVGR
jgi:hypothetical protein